MGFGTGLVRLFTSQTYKVRIDGKWTTRKAERFVYPRELPLGGKIVGSSIGPVCRCSVCQKVATEKYELRQLDFVDRLSLQDAGTENP